MEHAAKKNSIATIKALTLFKQFGYTPETLTYHAAMEAFAERRQWRESWALLEDMMMYGLPPDLVMFNHLLAVRLPSLFSLLWLY